MGISRALRRHRSVIVRADEGFCRDKVSSPAGSVTVDGTSKITFLGAGGQSVTVECSKSSYILDAGLEAGLELPFTCRGGICGACVGRVTQGEIDQSDVADLSFTVSEDEQAQGMALICMSRPVTDDVTIETQSDWGYALGITEWKGATGQILGKRVEPLMGQKWDEMK